MTYRILEGDVFDRIGELGDGSVQTVITSPPYWGLRDYGTATWDGGDAGCDHLVGPLASDKNTLGGGAGQVGDGYKVQAFGMPYRGDCGKCGARRIDSQIGLEPTPEAYVQHMVEVFREVRRVLRNDGTCWLNLGDSYANDTKWGGSTGGKHVNGLHGATGVGRQKTATGLKPKDLVGIPWRVAFALQADGWYLRSDIIWAKPNPMPESVTDRPTKAHEYIFLLTKSARYYFDADAVREAPKWQDPDELAVNPQARQKARLVRDGKLATQSSVGGYHYDGERNGKGRGALGLGEQTLAMNPAGRNIRTVWNIATHPYPEAHFATFPMKLIEPCIKAGTSEKGCCPICGAPGVRVIERTVGKDWNAHKSPQERLIFGSGTKATVDQNRINNPPRTIGWAPGCRHEEEPVPCMVFDPFAGSGTTGVVALRHQRSFTGIELNPEYAQMARDRIHNDGPLFNVEAVV